MSSTLAALLRHDLPASQQDQMVIERRRKLNAERNTRIFDPKVRTIGLDYDALERQVQEKIAIKVEEQERERDFANYTAHSNEVMQILDTHAAQQKKEEAKSLNQFRQTKQTYEARREYDMNRPNPLLYDPPIRLGDDCSISGLQQFSGEDLQKEKRIKEQHEQAKVWSYILKKEKEQKEEQQRLEREENDRQLMQMDAKKVAIASETVRRNREEAERNANYNKQLAMQRLQSDHDQKERDTAFAQREIYEQSHGAFLTESRAQSQTSSPNRVLVDSWKGMTVAQKYEILNTQDRQRREQEARQAMEREESRQFGENLIHNVRVANALEENKRQQLREENVRVAEENRRLAAEQRNRNQYMEKVVYKNEATNDYFNQFNTSSR